MRTGESAPTADLKVILESFRSLGEGVLRRVPYMIIGLLVILFFHLAGRLSRHVAAALGRRSQVDPELAALLGGLLAAILNVLGFFVAAVIVFPTFKPGDLLAGLGVTSIAVGFAFKDILQNWLAGVFILWRRPFQIGDQIQTRGHEGTVEHITVRSTIVKTYDGERVVVPNSEVYADTIVVRTAYDKRRVRVTVGVGYPDSLDEARRTIHRVLRETEGVLSDPGPWVYVTELAPSSVNFVVYFWTEPEQANVLRVSDRVVTGIKLALDGAGIDMPYPHRVVLFHDLTGTEPGGAKRGRPGAPEPAAHGSSRSPSTSST